MNYRLHYLDTLPLEHLIHHFFEMVPLPPLGKAQIPQFHSCVLRNNTAVLLVRRAGACSRRMQALELHVDVVPYGYAVIP